MRVEFPPSTSFAVVDTGITQVNKSFAGMSPDEPGFGSPSRVQVIPLAPTSSWANIGHSEPTLNPATGTIEVAFFATGLIPEPPYQLPPLNVLIWDPHSIVGPGEADPYNPPE
jgi:hypothetical protein